MDKEALRSFLRRVPDPDDYIIVGVERIDAKAAEAELDRLSSLLEAALDVVEKGREVRAQVGIVKHGNERAAKVIGEYAFRDFDRALARFDAEANR